MFSHELTQAYIQYHTIVLNCVAVKHRMVLNKINLPTPVNFLTQADYHNLMLVYGRMLAKDNSLCMITLALERLLKPYLPYKPKRKLKII